MIIAKVYYDCFEDTKTLVDIQVYNYFKPIQKDNKNIIYLDMKYTRLNAIDEYTVVDINDDEFYVTCKDNQLTYDEFMSIYDNYKK